ncbi:1-deoxy-D-xylulose 5-phosphate reductoisomerase [Cetobacterium ceti]|uniref:1-deoxy-D-xylulose 5-phosphate reductoisomerase n=1 Tax=Cetobacterium ceti TaxID=180163 RepID=A0A1T4Q590_9FUSO|nr:1-deoxy-D-xylulose-5-phosphate reductoisomerase [Cetobacterium ceti]SJZ98824.1 1-deoxy-D-xylulose 5-phosphate reductoisomerase [Cetobacterium ceti]
MKKIGILGSTGSIGTSALDVIRHARDKYEVVALSGYSNIDLLMEQIEEFNPKYVAIGFKEGYDRIKEKYPQINLFLGEEGLKEIGKLKEVEILLTAVSGAIGIEATVEGIKSGKRIALANKETMVAAGPYINDLLKKYPKAEIIPVDSEHSAIFQSLLGGKKNEVSKLIITASGGTFRGKNLEDLKDVTVEQALKHPNWSMGRKITIDSSTLVNKGLEIIEAHELFGVDYENIEVLVHPQSIVHSMVEFKDKSVIAQLGVPDMKIPIQYAFTYPERDENTVFETLDLRKVGTLTFEEPNREVFKGIDLAFKAGKIGKTMPAVLNAANEIAVELFLRGEIKFLEIYEIIEKAMDRHEPKEIDSIETIKMVDLETRAWVYKNYEK